MDKHLNHSFKNPIYTTKISFKTIYDYIEDKSCSLIIKKLIDKTTRGIINEIKVSSRENRSFCSDHGSIGGNSPQPRKGGNGEIPLPTVKVWMKEELLI